MGRALALLIILLVVPSAQAERSGATWVVKNFGDAPAGADSSNPGPEGSLRYILMRQAKAGDMIVFERPGQVELTAPLRVRSELRGLRIVGTVGEAKAGLRDRSAIPSWTTGTSGAFGLFVFADDVTVQGLVFSDVPLVVSGVTASDRPQGVRVLENLFTGRHGYLGVVIAVGTIVRGNEFRGHQDVSVKSALTRRTTIADNTFSAAGKTAIDDTASRGLQINGNRFESTVVRITSLSATVSGNTFESPRGVVLDVSPDAPQQGPISVRKNVFHARGGLVALVGTRAGRLELARNTFEGSGGSLAAVTCFQGGSGTAVVESNTFTRTALGVNCSFDARIDVRWNTVSGSNGVGIRVDRGDDVHLSCNTLRGNRQAGLYVLPGARVDSRGDAATGNGGAGALALKGARLSVRSARMGGNGGPGIDLEPAGQSPAAGPGAPTLKLDKDDNRLHGSACAGCLVEVYESEEGAKQGNPGHGEGIRSLGSVRAGGDGRFEFPAKGELDCPASGKLTATVTAKAGDATSEFSRDVECACTLSAEFGLDRARVPRNGFINFGIKVFLPTGATVTKATLTDAKTKKRPSPVALGPSLQWKEFVDKTLAGAPNEHDFFAGVTYRESAPDATGPSLVWHYPVAYDPPKRGGAGCGGKVLGVFLAPRGG